MGEAKLEGLPGAEKKKLGLRNMGKGGNGRPQKPAMIIAQGEGVLQRGSAKAARRGSTGEEGRSLNSTCSG